MVLTQKWTHRGGSSPSCCANERAGGQSHQYRSMGIIYKITSPSGKSYIGKTNGTLKRRLRVHMSSGSKCPAIKAAIEKYGEDAMSIDILAEVPDPLSNEWEMFMIKKHGTYGPGGYNLTPGGGRPSSKVPRGCDAYERNDGQARGEGQVE